MQVTQLGYPLSAEEVARIVRCAVPASAQQKSICDGTTDAGVTSTPAVLAIGAFDGVHLGHRELIECCVCEARTIGARSVVVTFDPDPSELVEGAGAERQLLSVADRASLCASLGVDEVFIIPFTSEFAAKTPIEFLDYLIGRLGDIACIHVGDNFRFGCRGAGNVGTLRGLGEHFSFEVCAHSLLKTDGAPVSSTRIRALLAGGRVREAASLLGRHHFVRGTVAHGRGEGTAFGFPTANVRCDARVCMPSEGVYACVVSDGRHAWPAAANVGTPPTFDQHHDSCFLEANLIGFEGNLYGRELAVVFIEWLRASRPFSSLEELERVVLGNIDWVRTNIGNGCVEVGA